MNTLAERIKDRMQATGLKNAQLAGAAGVRPPTSFNWASGKTKSIKAVPLLLAAAALGVTPTWLATGKGKKFPDDEHVTADRAAEPGPAHQRKSEYDKDTAGGDTAQELRRPEFAADPILREAHTLLTTMSPAGREQSIAYLRFMATQHAAHPSSTGGERGSIPHQKAA